jgi:hypothetical protein
MTAFYIVLKVNALLAIITLPLIGPKKKKVQAEKALSRLAVNKDGYLEYFTAKTKGHHPMV